MVQPSFLPHSNDNSLKIYRFALRLSAYIQGGLIRLKSLDHTSIDRSRLFDRHTIFFENVVHFSTLTILTGETVEA